MFKYDEALAAAFKIKKNIKLQENDVLHYRSKVLDLINEVFKSTQRLDLIVVSVTLLLLFSPVLFLIFILNFQYSIQPMLNVLFESQNKSNLKTISQRILSFFINLKNIRKVNSIKI
jgi:lipopolysaccharide/colanic/teichoic acid biosynthesis glycosyltransferase